MRNAPHRCQHMHTWTGPLSETMEYPVPSMRFCMECLEEERIEVGSIQIQVTGAGMHTLQLFCTQCGRTTYVPLLPEFSFEAIHQMEGDPHKVGPYWFHLPTTWPRCFHCHDRLTPPKARVTIG